MNEPLNPDQTPFETALRQLTPSADVLSAEETFYAAGWHAGCKASGPQRRHHEIRGFAMGMVCSLACCAVGIQIWPVTEVPEQTQIAESPSPPADVSTEIAAVESDSTDEVVMTPNIGGLDEVFALLSPARWFAGGKELKPREPLAVARPGVRANKIDVESLWSVTRVERRRADPPAERNLDTEKAEPPTSLRAFPLSPDVFDEWL